MRVERGEHAVDGRLYQLGFIRLLDIIIADLVEYVAEQIELAVGIGRRIGGRADIRERLRRSDSRSGSQNDAQTQISCFPIHPRAFSMSDFAHHGPGSIAVPSFRSSI